MHPSQLRHYMTAVGPPRGALVYMKPGTVRWVEAGPRTPAAWAPGRKCLLKWGPVSRSNSGLGCPARP